MEQRRLGRTGHYSSLAIMGTAAFWSIDQDGANAALNLALARGVNHIDVAPQYGNAQAVVGPWLETRRAHFFLGCKTLERTRDAAWRDLQNSLTLLRTDLINLYQFHAVTTLDTLDTISGPGGAFEAFRRARDEGLVQHLGITTHGMLAPLVALEAVQRMDLDTVMIPINPRLYADADYRAAAERLLDVAQQRDVGVQVIKHVAKAPWGDRPKAYNPWYEPYDAADTIEASVRFALSQPGVTCLASPADVRLLPDFFGAAGRFTPMDVADQAALIDARAADPVIFHGPEPISK